MSGMLLPALTGMPFGSSPVGDGGERYAPDFELKLNGTVIPAALRACITSVKYEDGQNAADRVEIGIANVDLQWLQQHIRGLGFSPFPTGVTIGPITAHVGSGQWFDMDNKVELAMGYAGQALAPMFTGYVTGIQASFPSGGMPTLTLVAHDKLEKLSRGAYARGFGPVPDAVIAAILSAENLLIPMIDPAVIGISTAMAAINGVFSSSGRKQEGVSDLDLMKKIAEQYDANFWVENDTFYMSRFLLKEYSPRFSLKWGVSLMEFSPRVSTTGAVVGVGMKVNLREIPLSFQISVYWDFNREALGLSVVPGYVKQSKSADKAQWTFMNKAITSPADIANSALAITNELRQRLNNRLTGSGSSTGDPRLRAGIVVRLEGLGPDFSGDYRVSSATHTIDAGGYRTQFEVRKEILP